MNPRHYKRLTLSCAVFLLVGAGCGTAASRTDWFVLEAASPFGAYPFQAVAYDFYYMSLAVDGGRETSGAVIGWPWLLVGGLISLPFDLISDVLVLPIDIAAWIAGHHKAWPR
jgi:uncharacterized protein YceK